MGNNYTTGAVEKYFYGILIPSNITVSWILNTLHVTWREFYTPDLYIEIWDSINSASPVLLGVSTLGASSFDVVADNTKSHSITLRASKANAVSGFSEPIIVPAAEFYYVDPLLGNDGAGHSGSIADPWQTVAYAATRAITPGDVIHLVAGTFVENNQIVLAEGVSLVGVGLASILQLNYVSVSDNDAAIMLTSPSGVSANGNQSISNMLIDGNALTCTRGIYIAFRNNVIIHDCTIKDTDLHGIIFNGTTSSWTTNPVNTSFGNRVHHCILQNLAGVTGATAGAEGGVRIMGQTGFEFDHNQSIQNLRVSGENADNIKGYANKGMKVHDNDFQRLDIEAWWNFYSEFHYSWGGFEVYNNTFVGGGTWDASGNVKDSYDFALKIYDNTFTTTTGAAVLRGAHRQPSINIESFTYSNDIYIYRNKFTAVDIPVLIENSLMGINNIHVYYNLMIKCENLTDAYSSGILIDSTVPGSVMNDIFVYNNVITHGASAFAGVSVIVGENINNLVIRNNIFIGPDMNYPLRVNSPVAGTVYNLIFTNSLSFGCTSNVASISGTITLVGSSIAVPINLDPLFVGAADFHLQAGSPCINTGVNVGLLTDYDGVIVSDHPEIGAYEFI